MDQSITVLLPDGRLIDAKLPAAAGLSSSTLAARLVFAGQVTIDCRSIEKVWDPAVNLPRTLELRTVRFLRPANPEEMTRAIHCPDWRRPGNLLHPAPGDVPPPAPAASLSDDASGDPPAMLEKARRVNLDRIAHLPNFIADELVECYDRPSPVYGWRLSATVHSEVTFNGMSQSRQVAGAGGKLVPALGMPAGCIGWTGGFGSYIRPVFDPQCGTTLTFSKTSGKPGERRMVYNYTTPVEGGWCYPPSFSGADCVRAYSAHEGSVDIDAASGDIVSLVVRSRSFPELYGIAEIEETSSGVL